MENREPDVQYNITTAMPATKNGQNTFNSSHISCNTVTKMPMRGKIIMYSVKQWGHLTGRSELPFCFSSTHRCKQCW